MAFEARECQRNVNHSLHEHQTVSFFKELSKPLTHWTPGQSTPAEPTECKPGSLREGWAAETPRVPCSLGLCFLLAGGGGNVLGTVRPEGLAR